MIPHVALIAFDVYQVWVERLLAYAELLPLLQRRLKHLLYWVIVCTGEVCQVVHIAQLIILLYGVDLASAIDAVNIDLVEMVRGEQFIVPNVLVILRSYVQLFDV